MTELIGRYLAGFVQVRLEGANSERVLDDLSREGFRIWAIRRNDDGALWCAVSRQTVPALHRSARIHHVEVHFGRRQGLARAVRRASQRPWLWAGLLTGLIGVWWLSGHIWIVDAPTLGSRPKARQELIAAAAKVGLRAGVRRDGINLRSISMAMERQLDNFFWVRVSLTGIVARIQAAEMTSRPPLARSAPLVAGEAGRVLKVETYLGEPLVGAGDRVIKGQPLIGGVEFALGRHRMMVPPVGRVIAEVTYRTTVYQAFAERRVKVQAPHRTDYQLLIDHGPAIPLSWPRLPFRQYRRSVKVRPIVYRGVEIPLEWRRVVYNEIKESTRQLTAREATVLAMKRAERRMMADLPAGGRWLQQARYIRRSRGGVSVTLIRQAEQNIAVVPPLLGGKASE